MNLNATNPYVGLRPYEAEESLLFFGRSEQTLELLQRLHEHHFVAVVGSSGCGKSSLLRAGLIPTLKAGYLVEDSNYWFIGIMKPGHSPLYNLAETLLKQINPETGSKAVDELVEQIKGEGSNAILDLVVSQREKRNVNFFLLVDQFEELFRFAIDQNDVDKRDEAIDFVNIVLELATQTTIPFYVVMTMRSDFIGDCSQFFGLPEAMNKSLYLVPKLNRQQLKRVIESPAKLFAGKINPSLTSRLLNELGKVKDELPLLQHALMRMWDFEMNVDKNGELDLKDYENIGGLKKALSKHADEALVGMSKEDLLLTKHIFQALTAIDENGRKIRRPVLLSQLKGLTGAKEEKLLEIINLFIKDKRSFLIVNRSGNTGDKVIDISHESLIRQWTTLSEWVDEEGESAAHYLQLNDAAKLHQQNKKDYLSGTELQIALDWYNGFNPISGWANRYKGGFDESIQYLKESENERTRLLYIENTKKRNRKRLMIIVGILLFIVAIGSGISYFYVKAKKAEVDIAYQEAKSQKLKADEQAEIAIRQTQKAEKQTEIAEQAKQDAEEQAIIAEQAKRDAEAQARLAEREKQNALKQTEIAKLQTNIANIERNKARANYLISEANRQIGTNPTLSLNLATEAMHINDDEVIHNDALEIYRDNSFYKIIAKGPHSIYSVVFSPDGKTILTGSEDSKARLWNMQGGMIQEFNGHTEYISSIAFSPDGKKILTGSGDSTAILWALNGEMIQKFTAHTGDISSVAFSPDGKTILTGSYDKTARLWSLDGETIYEFIGHGDNITACVFSPDGKSILTASADKTARLWNLKGEEIQDFIGHNDKISSIAFSPDGNSILTGSNDKTARLWNLQGETIQEIRGHDAIISAVAFSPDGKTLLTASYDKTARTWDLSGEMIQEFKGHTFIITSVAFSPGGKTILTGSWDKTARLWPVKGMFLQEFTTSGNMASVTFSPDGKTVLTGSFDKIARLWGLDGRLLQEFKGHTNKITSVAFSPDGRNVLTGSYDKTARLWNMQGEMIQEFIGHTENVSSVAFSPDGNTILTGSYDHTARLWDIQGELVQGFQGHFDFIYSVAFSPDGKKILTGSGDKTARLWDLTGNTIQEFKGLNITSVAFSPDGETILTGSRNSTRLWNLKGDIILKLKEQGVYISSVTFSPDGNTILTGNYDKTARLWNLHGEMIQEFKGHTSILSSVAFSPDGNTILTGSWDKTARLWEVDMPLDDFIESGWLEPLTAEQKEQFKIE